MFYQRECRAKFNSVQVSVKRKLSVLQPTPDAKHCRRSNATEKSDILFPNYCMLFNKKRITVRKQIQNPTKIVPSMDEKKIKSAAELKQDVRLLVVLT